jgi:pyruvate-formate lyase-activating enzyme
MLSFKNNCDGGFFNNLAYLNVFFTPKCDCNCIYCIAKEKMNTVTDELDIEKIADTILLFGWSHVVISGGEPLLYPDECIKLINFIRPYIKDITMFTSLPKNMDTEENYEKLKIILQRLDGCNISIRHYDYKIAHKISRENGDPSDFRNNIIRKLIKDGYADRFRLSLELCKGYLDQEKDVKNCLLNYYVMGVKNIKLGELKAFPDLFVPITKVLPIKFDKNIIWSGCSINIKSIPEWNFPNLLTDGRTLLAKRVCGLIQSNYKLTFKDKLKLKLRALKDKIIPGSNYKIILPNGELINQW